MITAELLGIEEDERKNIVIWVAYSKDGIDFQFYRGVELLEYGGRYAWPLTTTYRKFIAKNGTQRLAWIKINVEHQIGVIIQELVVKDAIMADVKEQLALYIGQTIEKDEVVFELDRDNDGVNDTTITLKDDGTYTVV